MHPGAPDFTTTHWSVILAARTGDPATANQAMEQLCRTYWYPVYAYVRQHGRTPEDAQDLTQEFFASLIRRDFLADVTREKGRFRAFLLACLRHFLSDQHDRATALKRGAGHPIFSLDGAAAEGRYQSDASDHSTPETAYERRWALSLLEAAQERLEAEYAASGRQTLLDQLVQFPLLDRADTPFHPVAERLHMTDGALKAAVYRMRVRYREIVREQISHTVADPNDLKAEIQHLIEIVSH